MLVLGIDPGSRTTGWGLVRRERGRYVHVASGALRPPREDLLPARLCFIYKGLCEVIATYKPEVAAIEAIFHHRSAESALRLGHARGIILLAVAQAGLPISEYNATHIKHALTGYGRAEKEQVGKVVSIFLGESFEGPRDITDALAVAITHLAHARGPAPLLSAPIKRRKAP